MVDGKETLMGDRLIWRREHADLVDEFLTAYYQHRIAEARAARREWAQMRKGKAKSFYPMTSSGR